MSLELTIKSMEFANLNNEIKRTMRRSARDAVQLGYMLRIMLEEKKWESAYTDFDSYLHEELNMDYSMANRFININKKYSWNGNSAEIDKKYEEYSQGTLIEMLNMSPEQMAKVTPDMTVKQVREIKKKDKEPEKEVKVEVIPGVEAKVIDVEKACEAAEKEVLKAEIEAVPEHCIEEDDIATSQCDNEPRKCITGLSKSGFCACCCKDGIKCCLLCDEEYCNGKCGWIEDEKPESIVQEAPEQEEPELTEIVEQIPESEISFLKNVLAKHKDTLSQYLEFGDIPENTVREQKIIVVALAAMLSELEMNEVTEIEEPEQPELPILKNNDQRKEWLRDYKSWGLWYTDEHIGVEYYKYDFPDGTRLIAERYPKGYNYSFLHLVGGPKEREKNNYGIPKYPYHQYYSKYPDNETELVEFLKAVQKKQGERT